MTQPSTPTVPARLASEAAKRDTGQPLDPEAFARTETPSERAARETQRLAHVRARWAERLPVMYADATMDDVADLDRDVVTWLAKEASPTLVLAGPVGTGKTHAAYAIANTAVGRGFATEAWSVTDLLAALRPPGDADTAKAIRSASLLVLDDLGAAKASDWAVETITALVDDRLRNGLRQIVTTNHPYEVLEAAWGARLLDRLQYRWTVVVLAGESRRKAAF